MKTKPPIRDIIRALAERDLPRETPKDRPMTTLCAVTEMDSRQTEIFAYCEKYFFDHENPALVTKNAKLYTEGYDAFGLDDQQLKALRDEIFTRFEPTVPEMAELSYHFFATGKFEFGSIALLLLKKHRPRYTREVYIQLKRCLDKGVENWSHTDLIAYKLTPVLLELNIATMEDFTSWLDSPSKWTRRAVAITMISQKTLLPVEEQLSFILPLMRDSDKAVQQGLGWFLRELWVIHPTEVEDFLYLHKEITPPLTLQFATEKMHPDKKKRFRRSQPNNKKPFKPHHHKSRPRKEAPGE